tara:strand:+ start:3609 stop:4232 length:624 start_codon:yes stop_codon:yes gene_type:complete
MNPHFQDNQFPTVMRDKLWRSERGIALAVVLGIMAVLLVGGVVVLKAIQTETGDSRDQRQKVQERLAAENAIQRVLNDFRTTQDTNSDDVFNDLPVVGNVHGDGLNYNDIDNNGINDFDQVFLRGLDIGTATDRITFDVGTDNQAKVWVDASNTNEAIIHVIGEPVHSEKTMEMEATLSLSLLNVVNTAVQNSPQEEFSTSDHEHGS